jgi:hypothetical protein
MALVAVADWLVRYLRVMGWSGGQTIFDNLAIN